jgi:ActR/RegA family two-component response regulator
MIDTVLIVDDEESVRRTFYEWLSDIPGVQLCAAADAHSALQIANETSIDLAVLDWNLGSGSDGLQLLEDLSVFQPNIIAILVTGFAAIATPLQALRMGVRDYLDKNHDLNRETFVNAVVKQLEKLRPAKRQRMIDAGLAAFRQTVEQVIPLVQTAAALNNPVPLPEAIHSLLRFLKQALGSTEAVLIVRHTVTGIDITTAFNEAGQPFAVPAIPFSQTLAAAVASGQEPRSLSTLGEAASDTLQLYPFEQNRTSIWAAPLAVGSGRTAIFELFSPREMTSQDKLLLTVAAEIGADLLKRTWAEQKTHRILFDAIQAALTTSEQLSPASTVLDEVKRGFAAESNAIVGGEAGLKLVQAIRSLAEKHGSPAVDHCTLMVKNLDHLLTDTADSR